MACCSWISVGCGATPTVTSPESQELILRFYTACNTKNPDRLASAIEIYRRLIERNQISSQEQKRFDELISIAQSGRWQDAADMAYSFSQSQVR
jgi:hypothetical protein